VSGAPPASPAPLSPLELLAGAWGIEPAWRDNWQRTHRTKPAAAAGLLRAMGVPAAGREEIASSLAGREEEAWAPLAAPTLVVTEGQLPAELLVHVPAPPAGAGGAALRVTAQITLEGGARRHCEFTAGTLRPAGTRSLRGREIGRFGVPFPAGLPLGYHALRLVAEWGAERLNQDVTLIVCPAQAWLPPELEDGGRAAGFSVALYGLRSARNWGCGDFGDLARLTAWAVERLRVSFIGLNPLHATRNRTPFSHSPYLPLSSLYHNYIYLDLESLPDFAASPGARQVAAAATTLAQLSRLRGSREVRYEETAQLKMRILRLMFHDFLRGGCRRDVNGDRRRFEDYLAREGTRLEHYALFCALDEHHTASAREVWTWRQWPEEYRRPDAPGSREFLRLHREEVLFHQYCQWLIDEQLQAVGERARRAGLPFGYYHDLAMAVDQHGADYWANQDLFAVGARVGAPPDAFNADGQDWGFPPPHPERDRSTGYRFFVDQMRRACRHAGLLRIDHAMRLARLFWIPDGMKAADGAYVRYREQELLGIVALESVRNRTVIVGEDLGVVPEGFRETMQRVRFFSCRLVYFERHDDGRFRDPAAYPRDALVSINTHDLATFTGWWEGTDLATRRAIGLIRTEEEWQRALEERRAERRLLLERLVASGLLPPQRAPGSGEPGVLDGELHNAVVGFVASTASRLCTLSQEDLFKEREQQNVPGTVAEHPNWVRTMEWTIEELFSSPVVRDFAAMYRGWVERTGRAPARAGG
jgi:4-alpha-glucanotransferase